MSRIIHEYPNSYRCGLPIGIRRRNSQNLAERDEFDFEGAPNPAAVPLIRFADDISSLIAAAGLVQGAYCTK